MYWKQRGYQKEEVNPISIADLAAVYGNDDEDVSAILGQGGVFTHAGMSHRPVQEFLAHQVQRSLKLRKVFLCEAPTGMGKSLINLVNAVLYSMRTGQTAIVATANNTLLNQYKDQDFPFLVSALSEWIQAKFGRKLEWHTQKGRTNYHCMAKSGWTSPLTSSERDEFHGWASETETGDLSDLSFDVMAKTYREFFRSVTADSEECVGEDACSVGAFCHFYKARAACFSADVVLTNHTILALDLQLGQGSLLPPYGSVFLDEAHQFAGHVRSALVQRLDWKRLRQLLGRLQGGHEAFRQAVGGWTKAIESLGPLERFQRVEVGSFRLGLLKAAGQSLMDACIESSEVMAMSSRRDAESLSMSLRTLADSLQSLLTPSNDRIVVHEWGENENAILVCPVSVSEFLENRLFKRVPVVLMSATLQTGIKEEDRFKAVKEELGINGKPFEMAVPSPFDWDNQALYFFPYRTITEADLTKRYPEEYSQWVDRWVDKTWPTISFLIEKMNGGAFVLSTGLKVAQALAARHRKLFGDRFPCFCQNELSKGETISAFQEAEGPVLYATSSYWEGVDIKNERLRLVIIDKIPFPPQDDLIEQAIARKLGPYYQEARQVPNAIIALKQACGRLVRSPKSKGVLCILDPRLKLKPYGRTILESLPGRADLAVGRPSTNVKAWMVGYPAECKPPLTPERQALMKEVLEADFVFDEPVKSYREQLDECGSLMGAQWEDLDERMTAWRKTHV